MQSLLALLQQLADHRATDMYLTVQAPPMLSLEGHLLPLSEEKLTPKDTFNFAEQLMNAEQKQAFLNREEINLSHSEPSVGRFRVNICHQRGNTALVIRRIEETIPEPRSLNLPEVMTDLILEKRGLILVVGATSSGKSTTLASLLQHRAAMKEGHIVTIEDPIEFLHPHARSLVTQREIGIDTHSYAEGLKSALRQAPDVIMIGEIRSTETMDHAITFAETGHLCLSTLHANNAYQALDRILHFSPPQKRDQLLMDLSFNLKAIFSQRLIEGVDGKPVLATEILVRTPTVSDLISKGKIDCIAEIIEKSAQAQMHTFDQDLLRLYREGRISRDVALKNADSQNNLRIALNLNETGKGVVDDSDDKFSLKDE